MEQTGMCRSGLTTTKELHLYGPCLLLARCERVSIWLSQLFVPFTSTLSSPSWPDLLAPQQYTRPGRVRNRVCVAPAEIWVTATPVRAVTRTGVYCSDTSFPRPSWPWLFKPHEKTSPPGKRYNQCNNELFLIQQLFSQIIQVVLTGKLAPLNI